MEVLRATAPRGHAHPGLHIGPRSCLVPAQNPGLVWFVGCSRHRRTTNKRLATLACPGTTLVGRGGGLGNLRGCGGGRRRRRRRVWRRSGSLQTACARHFELYARDHLWLGVPQQALRPLVCHLCQALCNRVCAALLDHWQCSMLAFRPPARPLPAGRLSRWRQRARALAQQAQCS